MDNKMIWILLIFILNRKNKKDSLDIEEIAEVEVEEEVVGGGGEVEEVGKVEELIENTTIIESNTFTLDIPHTRGKMKIMKKIGSYFPPEYISPINKSLIITERIVKLYETIDFIENSQINYIENSIPVKDNKERINHIMNTIKNEVPREDVKNMGMFLDLIINMDKYKNLLSTFSSIVSDSNVLNDPNKMLKIIEPLMDGQSPEEKKKMTEMVNMLKLMQNLDKK